MKPRQIVIIRYLIPEVFIYFNERILLPPRFHAPEGDGGGDCGAREARRGPWRGSVAVALRKVESGARAVWPQYRGFERSVTVQRVSVPRPARLTSSLCPPHCTLCELSTNLSYDTLRYET
ncbi:hypothetical protein B5X24_HaOG203564 [Helicoverpa armigera]|uniref:Uncharacterized protein n=1 Tax=Helicoverpa armigera TaxID=29058 RepID=A0A2W1BVM2_HELAM|nr:hypothetical protein B5X24_HaOG203564 [Helicoverpa armigera]